MYLQITVWYQCEMSPRDFSVLLQLSLQLQLVGVIGVDQKFKYIKITNKL